MTIQPSDPYRLLVLAAIRQAVKDAKRDTGARQWLATEAISLLDMAGIALPVNRDDFQRWVQSGCKRTRPKARLQNE